MRAMRCTVLLASAIASAAACGQALRNEPLRNEPLRPLPQQIAADPARVALGRRLFHDVRFARDNSVSCASCHDLSRGGAASTPFSRGAGGKPGLFNSPTVFNSVFNFRQSWTGAHASLEDLLDHIVERPRDFGSSWPEVTAKLSADADLAARFRDVYGDDIGAPYVMDALAQFLRAMVTPSRFDRYLRGEPDAINAEEKAGYARFKSYGCVACHQGVNVGGNMFQKFGAMRELPGLGTTGPDLGRYLLTGRDADRHVFRVPSLRNVALTAPYFHNGSVATLDEAVDVMFKYQLGRSASKQDKDLIVRFLHTLSGEQIPPAGALP